GSHDPGKEAGPVGRLSRGDLPCRRDILTGRRRITRDAWPGKGARRKYAAANESRRRCNKVARGYGAGRKWTLTRKFAMPCVFGLWTRIIQRSPKGRSPC